MKQYEILEDFKGSQTGSVTEQFTAGTVVGLTDYLADIVVPLGQARPVAEGADVPPAKKSGRGSKGDK